MGNTHAQRPPHGRLRSSLLRGPERGSRKLARRIPPIRRIGPSFNRKRDLLPAFGAATPKGERWSPILDTEIALPAGYAFNALTNSENPMESLAR